jgi:hypothetical protein
MSQMLSLSRVFPGKMVMQLSLPPLLDFPLDILEGTPQRHWGCQFTVGRKIRESRS